MVSSTNYQYVFTWSFVSGEKVNLAKLGLNSVKKYIYLCVQLNSQYLGFTDTNKILSLPYVTKSI